MDNSAAYVGNRWLEAPIDPYDDPWYRFTRLLRALDEVIRNPRPGAPWLDLGCHQGQFCCVAQARFGIVATGMDDWLASQKTDETWRYFQRALAGGIQLDEKFALISALEVLEHIVDTDAFLRDCNEHLERDGFLVLTTPNINSLRNRITVPLGKYPTGLEYRTIIHHVRLYNVSVLKTHLEEHGFSVQCVRGVSFLPMNIIRRLTIARALDEWLADKLPQLCNNILVVARKTRPDPVPSVPAR
jgi:2-polyprenyl-3-methyl-5-hydroxy-6-metoxy-1,4-benzoquinol methylase